jgi:hypothetical protein
MLAARWCLGEASGCQPYGVQCKVHTAALPSCNLLGAGVWRGHSQQLGVLHHTPEPHKGRNIALDEPWSNDVGVYISDSFYILLYLASQHVHCTFVTNKVIQWLGWVYEVELF